MHRLELLRSFIRRDEIGLEIGPSHSPVAPKSAGYCVEIVDHLDQEALKLKYAATGNAEAIEVVDWVWRGGSYSQLIGKRLHYDYIIASHVIEHTTDFIGFLKDCSQLLKPEGRIVLAVPDKRYCMDVFRPETGIGKIIDAHIRQSERPTAGSAVEYILSYATIGDSICWSKETPGIPKKRFGYSEAREIYQSITETEVYHDVHSWCFTADSFRVLIRDLYGLGFINLMEQNFIDTINCEFFCVLSANPEMC